MINAFATSRENPNVQIRYAILRAIQGAEKEVPFTNPSPAGVHTCMGWPMSPP